MFMHVFTHSFYNDITKTEDVIYIKMLSIEKDFNKAIENYGYKNVKHKFTSKIKDNWILCEIKIA